MQIREDFAGGYTVSFMDRAEGQLGRDGYGGGPQRLRVARRRRSSRLLVCWLVAAAYIVGGGGGGDELTANLWVDTTTSGNTCVDHGSLTAYATNDACNSFDAAWDAAEAGDVIGVAAGSYGSQVVNGDKASETRIVGVDQATVTFSDGEALGDHMTLENMTINSGATHGWTYRIGSASVAADNVTFRDVIMRGQYVTLEQFDGNNFTWDGGSLGVGGDTPGERCNVGTSDHEPIEFNGNSGHRIANITVWPQAGKDACRRKWLP